MNIHQYPTSESELPAYRVAVMQAALAGGAVECRYRNRMAGTSWCLVPVPDWNWGTVEYRIRPEPFVRRVVLKSADYPPVFWLRVAAGKDLPPAPGSYMRVAPIGTATEKLCTSFWHDRPRFGSYWLTEEQSLVCEYSTDRQTWKPCFRQVEV